jgi:hypothetical protein
VQNNHVFHQAKLLPFIKKLQWAEGCARLKHVIPGKNGAAESSRCIMQGFFLSSRHNAKPAPKLNNNNNNNLRQFPLAVSLERSSHGVTQSKMLTKRSQAPP